MALIAVAAAPSFRINGSGGFSHRVLHNVAAISRAGPMPEECQSLKRGGRTPVDSRYPDLPFIHHGYLEGQAAACKDVRLQAKSRRRQPMASEGDQCQSDRARSQDYAEKSTVS